MIAAKFRFRCVKKSAEYISYSKGQKKPEREKIETNKQTNKQTRNKETKKQRNKVRMRNREIGTELLLSLIPPIYLLCVHALAGKKSGRILEYDGGSQAAATGNR
jgi:hypothetical protein